MTDDIQSRYVQEQPPAAAAKDAYLAWATTGDGRSGLGLELFFEDGLSTDVIYYNTIKRIVATSHEYIGILTHDWVYVLKGQNLTDLLPPMREHRIEYIQAFNEGKHAALPAESDAPLVESIEIIHNGEWWSFYKEQREALRRAHLTLVADNTQHEDA